MTTNTDVFDIPSKEDLDLQEQRVNFFNNILAMASNTTSKSKGKKVIIEDVVEPKTQPKKSTEKKEISNEHREKMLENLKKGREKRKANVSMKKQPDRDAVVTASDGGNLRFLRDEKEAPKEIVKETIKEVIKEVPIIDAEYEEWKKQKQAKAQAPAPAPVATPAVIIQAPPKLIIASTYKKPIW